MPEDSSGRSPGVVKPIGRRRFFVLAALAATVVLVVAFATFARALAPSTVVWRLAVLQSKIRGDLPAIPFWDLVRWMAPGSPLYLEALAKSPNPHSGIHNRFVGAEDVNEGRTLYRKQCAPCHGESATGHVGPNLLDTVESKSDWTFFSTARWGRAGTSMARQPLSEVQIWQVHAYLRSEALGAQARQSAPGNPAGGKLAVDDGRILRSDPAEWLTYAGSYLGHRHTRLAQIDPQGVGRLRLAWVAQMPSIDRELEVSPIVADGVMFVTQSRGGVVALDARNGAVIWQYSYQAPEDLSVCCGAPNRGVAIFGNSVFVSTIDAHLVALDVETGKERWNIKVADYRGGYSMTGAPLAVRGRIIVGVAGGEFGIRGFIAAFDAASGQLLWKFNTVPGPGEFGHETWSGDSWKTGGAPAWNSGAYDAEQDLLIWGTGNPSPEFQGDARKGDNLFSESALALEPATGRLRWYYQFTPGDEHDWDSTQQPILANIKWGGRERAVVLWANRNAFFYALDRKTGEFLFAKPFVKQTWNEGFDARGRPKIAESARPSDRGTVVWPAVMASTNWWPPSYDPARQLVFIPSADAAGEYFRGEHPKYEKGGWFLGSVASDYSPNHPATAYLKAVDAQTGDVRWQTGLGSGANDFEWTVGGALSTGTGLVFSGYRDLFRCFASDTGKELWSVNLGGRVRGSPISYALDGQQYITVAAGHSVFTFRLP